MEKIIYNKKGDCSKDGSIIEDFVDYIILYEDSHWVIKEMIERGLHHDIYSNQYFISRSLQVFEKGERIGAFCGGFNSLEQFENYPAEDCLFPSEVGEVVEAYFKSLDRFKI